MEAIVKQTLTLAQAAAVPQYARNAVSEQMLHSTAKATTGVAFESLVRTGRMVRSTKAFCVITKRHWAHLKLDISAGSER